MEGKRFIHNLTLKNILSYGSEGVSIDLQPLNTFKKILPDPPGVFSILLVDAEEEVTENDTRRLTVSIPSVPSSNIVVVSC